MIAHLAPFTDRLVNIHLIRLGERREDVSTAAPLVEQRLLCRVAAGSEQKIAEGVPRWVA